MREAEFRAWLDQRLWKGEPLVTSPPIRAAVELSFGANPIRGTKRRSDLSIEVCGVFMMSKEVPMDQTPRIAARRRLQGATDVGACSAAPST